MVYAETTGTIQAERHIPVSRRPILTEDEIKNYAEKLSVFSEFMNAEGVPISYHHHMGTVIETEKEIDLLMAHSCDKVLS